MKYNTHIACAIFISKRFEQVKSAFKLLASKAGVPFSSFKYFICFIQTGSRIEIKVWQFSSISSAVSMLSTHKCLNKFEAV